MRRIVWVSGVVVAGVLVWSGLAYASPVLMATPTVLAPTQTITVSGTGFAATEPVDVYLDTVDLALASTDASGNFSGVPVAVPASASPGNHWLTLVGRRDVLSVQKLVTVHTGWAERGWSAFGRSLNPFENLLSPASVGGLQEDWTASSGPVQGGGAVVPSGSRTAIFGDTNGVVRSVSLVTGATVWTRPLGGLIQSMPAVDSGRVYVVVGPSGSGTVAALNSTTGAIVWQTPSLGLGTLTSPAVSGNVVYVGSRDHNLYALNGSTGAVIWKGPTGGGIDGSAAVSGGRVFVGSTDATVYAFAVGCATGGASCAPLWTFAYGGTSSLTKSSPTVSNGVVYIALEAQPGADFVYAFAATSGRVLWTGALGNGATADIASPAVANGLLFMDTVFGTNTLTVFPAACGVSGSQCHALWHSTTFQNMQVMPAVANGLVYVSAEDPFLGEVMAFPASASCSDPCAPLWTATQVGSVTSPVVSDGLVLAGLDAGNGFGGLVAWDLAAGTRTPVGRPDPVTLKPDPTLKHTQ
jgi:outer membrane protein assembly factor BamB